MPKLEEVGRALDRELKKLREFFESEVKPTTQRRLVQALRAASKRLAELASELESQSAEPPAGKKQ